MRASNSLPPTCSGDMYATVPKAEPGLVSVGDVKGGRGCSNSSLRVSGNFGQSKVEDFGEAATGDKDVAGFNVAMNDAFGVGGVESVGDLDGEGEQGIEGHGAAGDAVLQRGALEEFHSDEGWPACSPMSWMVQMLGWLNAEAA